MESEIEKYLVRKVKQTGGLCYKWTSPGIIGVPDRIVLKNKKIIFVELKRKGARPRPSQLVQIGKIENQGFEVRVIDSKEKVDKLIEELREE